MCTKCIRDDITPKLDDLLLAVTAISDEPLSSKEIARLAAIAICETYKISGPRLYENLKSHRDGITIVEHVFGSELAKAVN